MIQRGTTKRSLTVWVKKRDAAIAMAGLFYLDGADVNPLYFTTSDVWRELERLARAALGRQRFTSVPLHFLSEQAIACVDDNTHALSGESVVANPQPGWA
ncbi:hypothetical protein BHJ80_20995 [Escherichia coli]|nr:hypothetical protein BHJ80_20995 [Escherichia coli]